MNLYDQLVALQKIPHAFNEWHTYREQLTHYLMDYLKPKGTLAIWGAGSCQDIDLQCLAQYFPSIVLLDKDEKGMQAALTRYGLKQCSTLSYRVVDFVGISEEDYRSYADCLIGEVQRQRGKMDSQLLAYKAQEVLLAFQSQLSKTKFSLGETYENSVVVGVHSQLFSMLEWIWTVILQAIGQEEWRIRNQIIAMNDEGIVRFNQLILENTASEIVIGCEEGKIGHLGTIQGAYQCLVDIERRLQQGQLQLLNTKILQWPFHVAQGTIYKMRLQHLKK